MSSINDVTVLEGGGQVICEGSSKTRDDVRRGSKVVLNYVTSLMDDPLRKAVLATEVFNYLAMWACTFLRLCLTLQKMAV